MKATITTTVAALLLIAGCSDGKEKTTHDFAGELFGKLQEAGKRYTDSMAAAKDSTAIYRIDEEYEERLAKIADEYPAETDNNFSETQNEILYNITERYITIRKKRLDSLSSRRDSVARPDSAMTAPQ